MIMEILALMSSGRKNGNTKVLPTTRSTIGIGPAGAGSTPSVSSTSPTTSAPCAWRWPARWAM
jgi:hypothetical protein